MSPAPKPPLSLLAAQAVFFASGIAGILVELSFAKHLTFVFGAAADATSTVLAVYMGGLALGGWLFGRRADRSRVPLKLYAYLELGVAAFALAAPLLIAGMERLYLPLARALGPGHPLGNVVGMLLSALVLLGPTTLMGGTFPVFCRALVGEDRDLEARVPTLYGANTLGAAFGALVGTYLALPHLGLSKTLMLAAAVDVVAALVAWRAARAVAVSEQPAPAPVAFAETKETRLLLFGAFASGFTVLALEVVWTHVLATVAGTSAYAFGIMLFTFLVGLGLGGYVAGRLEVKAFLAPLHLALGAAVILLSPYWAAVPGWFGKVGPHLDGFAAREAFRFVACFAMMIVPTLLMGAVYPMIAASYAAKAEAAGARLGRLAAVNTTGSILGSLAGAFVVLPLLGSQHGMQALAGITLAMGATYALAFGHRLRKPLALASAAVAAVAFVLPAWNPLKVAAGSNVYFHNDYNPNQKLLYVREDSTGGFTTVTEYGGVKTLRTNGKFQGDDGTQMTAQRSFALLPLLFTHKTDKALVIGFGSGVTSGTIGAFPYSQIDIAELSAPIYDAAGTYFGHVNGDILKDARVHPHLADGRHLLAITPSTYDLITVEVTSIWFAGASALYTREFYEHARDRLAPDGVLQQWVQFHHITPLELAKILATVREVFPHAVVYFSGMQGMIVASREPLTADFRHLAKLQDSPKVKPFVASLPGGNILALMGGLELTERGVETWVEEVRDAEGVGPKSMVCTDDDLYLEYSTPRGNTLGGARYTLNLRLMREHKEPPTAMPVVNATEGDKALVAAIYAAAAGDLASASKAYEDAKAKDAEPASLERFRDWLLAQPGYAALAAETPTR